MTGASMVFLAIATIFSLMNWWAVATTTKLMEYISKPAATISVLLVAVTLDAPDGKAQMWRILALVLCLTGDVFLMLPRDAFIQGLASFAVAQLLFVVSFSVQDAASSKLLIGLVIVAPILFVVAQRFVKAISRSGNKELVLPVVIYMIVIGAMAVGAIAGGTAWGIAGAFLFLLSDSLIAEDRFVKSRTWQPVGIMVTYHAALLGLVLGLV